VSMRVQPAAPVPKTNLRVVRTPRVTIPVETEPVREKSAKLDSFEQALVCLIIVCFGLLAIYNVGLWLAGKLGI
jgi:cell division protein FtsL